MYEKKFNTPLLIIIIAELVIVLIVFMYRRNHQKAQVQQVGITDGVATTSTNGTAGGTDVNPAFEQSQYGPIPQGAPSLGQSQVIMDAQGNATVTNQPMMQPQSMQSAQIRAVTPPQQYANSAYPTNPAYGTNTAGGAGVNPAYTTQMTQPVTRPQIPQAVSQNNSTNTPTSTDPIPEILKKAKSFKVGTMKFLYPASLSLAKGEGVTVYHRISSAHVDTCTPSGMATQLSSVTDVSISFKLVSDSLKNVMKGAKPDKIIAYQAGSFDGYRVEATNYGGGCGATYNYYFPIKAKQTLIITRRLPSELNQLNPSYNSTIKLPGIIDAATEDAMFNAIISSKK